MQCRHCNRKFKTDAALNEHLWAKHKEVKLPPQERLGRLKKQEDGNVFEFHSR